MCEGVEVECVLLCVTSVCPLWVSMGTVTGPDMTAESHSFVRMYAPSCVFVCGCDKKTAPPVAAPAAHRTCFPCPVTPPSPLGALLGEDQPQVWRDLAVALRHAVMELEEQVPPNRDQVGDVVVAGGCGGGRGVVVVQHDAGGGESLGDVHVQLC